MPERDNSLRQVREGKICAYFERCASPPLFTTATIGPTMGKTRCSVFDIHKFMTNLVAKRSLYHSEADFQHDFAWNFHQQFPDSLVRLEYPIRVDNDGLLYLDLWLQTTTTSFAIELKYKTRSLQIDHNGESFHLKNQGAQDLGRYDFLKDVARLERIKRVRPLVEGYAVLLTNDSSYWGQSRGGTIDEKFRLHDGRQLAEELGWHPNAGDGTTRGRSEAIRLSSYYVVAWKPFSMLSARSNAEFRYLTFRV